MTKALLVLPFIVSCSFWDPEVGPASDASIQTASDGGDENMEIVDFKRDIRPLMNRSAEDPTGHGCRACHYSTEAMHMCLDITTLDLATLGSLRKGGSRTHDDIIVPGNPSASAIVQKLRGSFDGGLRMPRNGPPYWSEQEIELVERWIAQGAKGDDSE